MKQERNYTPGEYKRLSDRIRKNADNISQEDYEMLQALRIAYKTPLATIFTSLNTMSLGIDKNSVCTYRIKRIESILSKLRRFPKMQVQRIADIAGCRCIMTSYENAIKLYAKIKEKERVLPFTIEKERDYVKEPKEDGYRSIHLEVRPKDCPERVIEIQIRCLEHHNWATLVEISDVLFQSKLKEFGNKWNPKLYEFHQLLAKQDVELDLSDKRRISEISGDFRYLERLGVLFVGNYLDLRAQRNKLRGANKAYFLLISTDNEGKPELRLFGDFCEAEDAYFEMFLNNPENKNIVLAHFKNTTFDKISIAYSNYFMTYNETLFRVLGAIADVSVDAFNRYKIREFRKNYKAFWCILSSWFGDKLKEAEFYNEDKNIRKSDKKKREWISSMTSNVSRVNIIIANMQRGFNTGICYYFLNREKMKLDKELSSKGILLLRQD